MRVAALIKQIPAFEEMELGSDGRLKRDGLQLEMNPYCRRAVAQAVELAATLDGDHSVTFLTLGPPRPRTCCGRHWPGRSTAASTAEGCSVTDPRVRGLGHVGDCPGIGRGSRARGAVRPRAGRAQLGRRRHWPGRTRAGRASRPPVPHRNPSPQGGTRCRAWCTPDASTTTGGCRPRRRCPRFCRPPNGSSTRARSTGRGAKRFPPSLLHACAPTSSVTGRGVRPGAPPRWARCASTRWPAGARLCRRRARRPGARRGRPARGAGALEHDSALDGGRRRRASCSTRHEGLAVAVVVEPDRPLDTRELLGAAARLAAEIDGHAVAVTFAGEDPDRLAVWGADAAVQIEGATVETTPRRALGDWIVGTRSLGGVGAEHRVGPRSRRRAPPRAGAGLTGDAVGLEVDPERTRLGRMEAGVRWSARGRGRGQLTGADGDGARGRLAGGTASRRVDAGTCPPITVDAARSRPRARPYARRRPRHARHRGYGRRRRDAASTRRSTTTSGHCSRRCGAELGATRKVTDAGWLPRARQIGITGRSIAPLPVRVDRRQRQVQPHGRRARRRHRTRDQPRTRRARIRRSRHRHRRRLARRRSPPSSRPSTTEPAPKSTPGRCSPGRSRRPALEVRPLGECGNARSNP